jgi:hypothetical protein
VDLQEVLSWLPADTETITVARGPFVLARDQSKADQDENRTIGDGELGEFFETLPLSLLGFKDELLLAHLKGKRILLAVEGARHFRPPSGLGEMPYEGCTIALFADDLGYDVNVLGKENRKSTLKTEQIEGQASAVLQEKLENDIWTVLIAFPNKRMLVMATNRDYLREVLARLQGKKGKRALPNDLPEWKYVNTELRFWGLRHFDKDQAKTDPTSPYGEGHLSARGPDQQAIGLSFAFDPSKGKLATITYLSGNENLGVQPDASLLSMWNSPEAKDLEIKYRELAPGVVEGAYNLSRLKQLQFFSFAFGWMWGHGVVI